MPKVYIQLYVITHFQIVPTDLFSAKLLAQSRGTAPGAPMNRSASTISSSSSFSKKMPPPPPSSKGLSSSPAPYSPPATAAPPPYAPSAEGSAAAAAAASKRAPPPPPLKSKPKPAVQYVVALYDFAAQADGDLDFKAGDKIEVVERTPNQEDWWTGRLNGKQGVFPGAFVLGPSGDDPY